jgi:hypothetical protein
MKTIEDKKGLFKYI